MDSAQLERVSEHLSKHYIEPGKISGSVTLVARRGQVCLLDVQGYRDVERSRPMTADSIMRIYSMTKPITSLAMMTLHEKGLFSLDDPVHRYIPGWRDLPVWKTGSYPLFETVPARRAMTIRDLFMHTSGITYDFLRDSNIDYAYRKAGVGRPRLGYTLQQMVDELAQMPLLFSPGDRWNYSLSTDVLGYLVEILSGQSLPDYLRTTIFEPLGMHDTCFEIPADKVDRFASCYTRNMEKGMDLTDDARSSEFAERTFYSGGGGLLSTAGDYYRFCQMLLGGGTRDGVRIIGPRTLDYMTRNHIPGGADMGAFATGSFSEAAYEGVGFGLGFASTIDPICNGHPVSPGIYFWGGLASTLFWVDPAEEMVVIFMTQLIPSRTFNFRGQLENIIYAALN
ncbi:class A beta-lactamase-related serine hydrolase [Halieaceae bacterium IMCC11814]|uniref:Class A beta-lactamase-related serine hydrolase n=2 Tax=Candidatus Marimicrobium litorale TaxID=2518991 RepID=A0ABT3T4H3_9GAMM|nr:class A beta-lactamase-related serine hydrolase [Candidatus Marimicrobium litorale]